MADNVLITAGVGTSITTDQASDGSQMQVVKLAVSADSDKTPIPATAANGITVDVTRVAGVVHIDDNAGSVTVDGTVTANDGGGSLTVDAPVGTPVFVRLSDGASPITTLPVSGAVTVSGTATVSGTVAATQSGTWNVGTVATITNVVHIDDNSGSISIDDGAGSITVDGAVTVTQGTAAAAAGAWPMKITDGTDTVGISTVSAAKAMKVDIVQTVFNFAQVDGATFGDLSQKVGIIGAEYNGFATDLTVGQAGALRCTAKRSLMVSILRQTDGAEMGNAGAPIRTDPTNTTATTVWDGGSTLTVDAPQGTPVFVRLSDGTNPIATLPVSGAVTITGPVSQSGAWTSDLIKINGAAIVSAAAGIQKVGIVDGVGAVWSATNPVPVVLSGLSRTRVTNANTMAASETAVTIWTPAASAKACVTSMTITVTGSGVITVYDGTNSAVNWLYKGTLPVGLNVINFAQPWISAAVNNVIRYTTGASVVAELQIHGFESN